MQIHQMQPNWQDGTEHKELDCVEQRECSMKTDRIGLFVEMIMAQSTEERNQVLKKLQDITKK